MEPSLSAAFANSLLAIELETGWVTLTPDPGGGSVGHPGRIDLWVVTAFNPGGALRSLEENRRAHADLVEALTDAAPRRTIAGNADGSYVEPGRAFVDDTAHRALGLARRFDQAAVFRWHSAALEVVDAGGAQLSATPWRLEFELHPGLHAGLELVD